MNRIVVMCMKNVYFIRIKSDIAQKRGYVVSRCKQAKLNSKLTENLIKRSNLLSLSLIKYLFGCISSSPSQGRPWEGREQEGHLPSLELTKN